jgi:hypothetical protein
MNVVGDWIVKSWDLRSTKMEPKRVTVVSQCDHPCGEDYVSIVGLREWEVDLPIRQFMKIAIEKVINS